MKSKVVLFLSALSASISPLAAGSTPSEPPKPKEQDTDVAWGGGQGRQQSLENRENRSGNRGNTEREQNLENRQSNTPAERD